MNAFALQKVGTKRFLNVKKLTKKQDISEELMLGRNMYNKQVKKKRAQNKIYKDKLNFRKHWKQENLTLLVYRFHGTGAERNVKSRFCVFL